MSLRLRLEAITERAVLFQIVNDVVKDPKKYPNAVREFCESIDCFSKFLTDKEYFTTLLPVLDTQCPLQSLIGFSKSMSSVSSTTHSTSFRDVMTVLQWLKYVVEKRMETIIENSLGVRDRDEESIELYHDFAKACQNLPEKISNCLAKAATEDHVKYIDGVKEALKTHVLQGIQQSLLLAHARLQQQKNAPSLRIVSMLISGGRETLLPRIMRFIGDVEPFDDVWRHITSVLFQQPSDLGVQVHEALLTSLFLTARSEDVLRRCLETRVLTGTLRRVVMVKLPFQRILKTRNLRILVDFVHATSEERAVELFETSLKLWSDVNFARNSTEPQERHLVRLILYSIFLFLSRSPPTSSSIPWSDLFLLSMNGFHTRASLLPTHIQSALLINETLGEIAQKHLPPGAGEKPPKPVEVKEEDTTTASAWLDEMRHILREGLDETREKADYQELESLETKREEESDEKDAEARSGETKHTELEGRRDQSRRLRLDSDEEAEFEDGEIRIGEDVLPLDSDDDEDFPAYRVPENERNPRKTTEAEPSVVKVPPPAYIADAFEMLLEREKYEVFEAAFFALKELIRRQAIGFREIAEKLFVRVIYLQDHFGTKNFTETCEHIAVHIIANRPEIVPALVRLIIAPGQGIQTQARFLHYIHQAADIMGTLGQDAEEFVHGTTRKFLAISMDWPNVTWVTRESIEPNFDDVVRKRIAQKTRKFGAERKRPEVMEINRLSQKSRYMFYPLLVLPRGENAGLFNKDSELLAHIIMVASMVYVRCGVTHATAQMTTELISYVTPHRYSDNMKLRAACLIAHLNVMALVPGEILLRLFPITVRKEWKEWAESVKSYTASTQMEYGMARQLICLMEQHFQQHDETFICDDEF